MKAVQDKTCLCHDWCDIGQRETEVRAVASNNTMMTAKEKQL